MSGKVADGELEGWPLNLIQSTGQDQCSGRKALFIHTDVTVNHRQKEGFYSTNWTIYKYFNDHAFVSVAF